MHHLRNLESVWYSTWIQLFKLKNNFQVLGLKNLFGKIIFKNWIQDQLKNSLFSKNTKSEFLEFLNLSSFISFVSLLPSHSKSFSLLFFLSRPSLSFSFFTFFVSPPIRTLHSLGSFSHSSSSLSLLILSLFSLSSNHLLLSFLLYPLSLSTPSFLISLSSLSCKIYNF